MAQQRFVLFVGSAGAGKSWLINRVSGLNAANECARLLEDGTLVATRIEDPVDHNLIYLDTPGIDSNNVDSVSVRDYVFSNLLPTSRILLVFVFNLSTTRVTKYMGDLESLRMALIGDVSFLIYWNDNGNPAVRNAEEKMAELSGPYRNAETVTSPDRLRELLRCAANRNFHRLRVREMAVKVLTPASKVTASKSISRLPPPNLGHIGVPRRFSSLYLGGGAGKEEEIDSLCGKAVTVRLEGGLGWSRLTLMGDALLKHLVLGIIDSENEKQLETKMLTRISNSTDGPMNRFFDEYLREALKTADFELGADAGHAKADFVEALLQLACDEHSSKALVFILKKLMSYH